MSAVSDSIAFGKKGESSFPELPSDSNSSHQVWRLLINIHLLFYQEDRQSNFAKIIQVFRITKPISLASQSAFLKLMNLPPGSECLYPNSGCDIRAPRQAHPNQWHSDVQISIRLPRKATLGWAAFSAFPMLY